MPDTLPRPTVTSESTQENGVYNIKVQVTREEGKTRVYTGVGTSTAGAARELVENIFEDHNSAEFVKKG